MYFERIFAILHLIKRSHLQYRPKKKYFLKKKSIEKNKITLSPRVWIRKRGVMINQFSEESGLFLNFSFIINLLFSLSVEAQTDKNLPLRTFLNKIAPPY